MGHRVMQCPFYVLRPIYLIGQSFFNFKISSMESLFIAYERLFQRWECLFQGCGYVFPALEQRSLLTENTFPSCIE